MISTLAVITVIAITAAMLVYAHRQPDHFRIERSLAIAAPREKIHTILDDIRRQGEWSPWDKKDPNMKRTFAGPERGVGAVYEWDGNRQIGKGRMEVLESSPERIVTRLEFLKPFKATNTGEFLLRPENDGTVVTWAMYGPQPFVGKVMNLVMNCDRMVGREFEKGLADLKTLAERP